MAHIRTIKIALIFLIATIAVYSLSCKEHRTITREINNADWVTISDSAQKRIVQDYVNPTLTPF